MNLGRLRQLLRTTHGVAVSAAVLAAAAGAPAQARAQDRVVAEPSPVPPGHVPIIVDPPLEPPSTLPPMSEEYAYRYAELNWTVLRLRNVLITSSVATAVGFALVLPAEATQCGDTDPEGEMTLNRCSPGGKAMVLFGYPMLLIGGICMIASGIALGVMKGKLRRFEPRAARRKSRALRWDPSRSGFVF